MDFHSLYQLQCGVQHYPWGGRRHGKSLPFIAELTGRAADLDEPFAELWIGAHPTMPADVLLPDGNCRLDRLISRHPGEMLGWPLVQQGWRELPFLLKILDAAEPLSIQAHPDKALAEKLHACDPEHYPDANHKPEIAISLRGMDALCQFRPWPEIADSLRQRAVLRNLFADLLENSVGHDVALKTAYARLFQLPAEDVRAAVQDLQRELTADAAASDLSDEWFLRLARQYPGDRGTFSAYFLNIVHLAPGESVFLAANEPHAYLGGTIVECMASSDNVVRAGLTGKFIDREVLTGMLTYRQVPPAVQAGREIVPGEILYETPADEFQVELYSHDRGECREYVSEGVISVLMVLQGSIELRWSPHARCKAERGSAWVWPAALAKVQLAFAEDAVVVRARPNLKCLSQAAQGLSAAGAQ
jgi:mannose-6-phosphate isomerase